jgi:outer membrane protein assembly factor BamB
VFIAPPERLVTAIDHRTGTTVWRTGDFGGRESIGISEDGSRVYIRAMNDMIHAVATSPPTPTPVWTTNAGFGYDINSAMLAEKDGVVFYATKNGVVTALDAGSGRIAWQHRFGVGLVNTVVPLAADRVLVADIDGRVGVIEYDGARR